MDEVRPDERGAVRGRRLRARLLLFIGVVAIVLGSSLWILARGRGPGHATAKDQLVVGRPVAVDRPAPPFTQPLLSTGRPLSLARYEDRVVVLNFWASNCDACRTEGPALERLWRSYGGRDVRFIGVDYEDGRSAALRFTRAHGLTYPSVVDPNGGVGDAYAIFGLPTTYVIGPGSRIRFVVIGKVDVRALRTAIDSLLRTARSG
jgi:peroxiredoxin